ncbi:hypothetical protein LTR53_005331 [Teratosphaeriaceae sp. CCFEE 6253]|nr:hypothetical protein LTR53_005331 [Teratosphaeriaceae sp. CCFEE 6253]
MRRHAARTTAQPHTPAAPNLLRTYDAPLNPSRPLRSSPLASSTIANLPLELLDRLKAFPLFATAPESFLLSIGRSLRPSIYQPAAEIIREGEDARAMYWLVRGSVRVTSRDGESTYAELKPGAFFGEIGILMGRPRTASIVASSRSLVVRLDREDLAKELPQYPDVERAIREEALERLSILERKKQERGGLPLGDTDDAASGILPRPVPAPRKRSRDWMAGEVEMGDAGTLAHGEALANKRRKSPSPLQASGIAEAVASGEPPLTVRSLLKELPLFAGLPNEILHFLGVNAQPVSFAPFTEILQQESVGRDVYFILSGEVEVLLAEGGTNSTRAEALVADKGQQPRVRARLKVGQYFGEVTSLALAPRRTATVRSVGTVECLLISGATLDELWSQCSPDLRMQVEEEAKRRMAARKGERDQGESGKDVDVVMADAADVSATGSLGGRGADGSETAMEEDEEPGAWRKSLPKVTFEEPPLDDGPTTPTSQMEPVDPDPFFNRDLDNMRAKSRRSSLAPPVSPAEGGPGPSSPLSELSRTPSPPSSLRLLASSPLKPTGGARLSPVTSPSSPVRRLSVSPTATRRPSLARLPSSSNTGQGRLPDALLVSILAHLDLLDLLRLRAVSAHWFDLLTTSPDLLHTLNLAPLNRRITDDVLKNVIVPFIGRRMPRVVNMSDCFHVGDTGFVALAEACGESARVWRMKSVWDVSGPAVLGLVERAKGLEEIDLSNCRKVGDNLLARVVGWVVPDKPPNAPPAANASQPPMNGKRHPPGKRGQTLRSPSQPEQSHPVPGTIIGAPRLRKLTLSYCKHIQDRSMLHLAHHAAARLTSLDLTRCTSISDAGFAAWSPFRFPSLHTLILADCTYLSDAAIVGIVAGCRALRTLDLSFCCALSDTATEVLALGLPKLRQLNMAFCGSAVSDNSLRCVALHLLELRYLSVRGCVRVTGHGIESVVEGCGGLVELDASQCRNLRGWLEEGGGGNVRRVRGLRGGVKFGVVADGSWRASGR